MGSHVLPTGVGFTALVAAYSRTKEADRSKPLFADPLAARFVAAAADAGAPRLGPANTDPDRTSHLWEGFYTIFAGRTPFFDDNLMRHVENGVRQVVILGAGLDTRAYRLDLPPDTVVYEIDTEPVLDFKAAVLADEEPRAKRVPVAVDLRDDWKSALHAAGFDPGSRTVWLVEGLVFYLDAADADALIAGISSLSAEGSGLIVESFKRPPVLDDVPDMDEAEVAIARIFIDNCRSGPTGTPAEWMAAHGWRVEHDVDFVDVLASQDRAVPALFTHKPADPFVSYLTAGTQLRG